MSRSTTVRVVNATASVLQWGSASLSSGRWSGAAPGPPLPPRGLVTFRNEASNRFGSAAGEVRYLTAAGSVSMHWSNPLVGRNSYRIDTADTAVGVVCDGDDDDQQTVVTFTIVPSRKVKVPGFLPSTHAFRFTNSWPDDPLKRVNLHLATVPIGSASNGLCGGMAYAVRDWYEARRPIPTDTVAPPDKSALRSFIIDRLIDSFDLPAGVVPYATIMSSRYPNDDSDVLAMLGQVPSRATLLARRTWPDLKACIDRGHLCPLGLVMVESDDPADLRHHHQVLAYAYQVRGTALTVWVYDPNSPGDDGITISFDTSRTDRAIPVRHKVDSKGPLVCAFLPRYVAATPPT